MIFGFCFLIYAKNLMIRQKRILFLFIIFLFLFNANNSFAGFGITPPYVRNDNLTRNSHYEQKIILVRSDPDEDLQAKITIDVPKIGQWISVDRGAEFILPKGETQIPIVVSVDIPDDAEFGNYKGNIRAVISPLQGPHPGTVGIALGAQIDVDLNIVDRKIFDFKVRRVRLFDAEEGRKFWWMFFPGKITFSMQIQNVGNVPYSPTRVDLDIYDAKGEALLESVKNTNKIEKVQPFKTKEVVAEIPTKLKHGSYKASYKIFKGEEIAQAGQLNLSILPYGSLPGYKGYGFIGLPLRDQSIIVLASLLVLFGIIYGVWMIVRKIRRKNVG